jgi:hypothetical protein
MKQKTKVETDKSARMIRPVTTVSEEKPKVTAPTDDFMDAIESIAAPKEPTTNGKKDKMTQVELPADLKIKVDEYVEAKKKEREYKTAKENRQDSILEFVKDRYEADGLSGNFQKSYRVPGVNETVTFVSTDRFSNPSAEEIPVLKELLGDRFDDFVSKKTVVSIKEEVMSTPELRAELISYVPKEVFGKFFKADVYYSTADEFDRKLFSLPKKIYDKIKAIVRQASPSLK